MREFALKIEEALEKGLRRVENPPRNSPYLVECYNLKPKEGEGAIAYDPVSLPFSSATLSGASVTIAHPFPQLFRGKETTLLADQTRVFTVDESDWSLTLIATYDALDVNTTKNITSGGIWHFVDFGTTWMLLNGSCVVFQANYPDSTKVFVTDSVDIETACGARGRGIFGGFNPSKFWSKEWELIWESWISRLPIDATVSYNMDIKDNFVMWTTIGGGDLLWLFYPELALKGTVPSQDAHDLSNPLLFDMLKRNELGFMPMPWQGTVRVVKPLGKNIIVYGDDGVAALTLSESTFGLEHISSVGIDGRGSVGGDESEHIYLDEKGFLWSLDAGLSHKRLGYKEFFGGMLGSNVTISFDPEEREYFICNSSKGYVLTRSGLAEMNQLVSSVIYASGGLKGIQSTLTDKEARIVTGLFDMGLRSLKSLESVEVGVASTAKIEAGVDFRFKKKDTLTRTLYKVLNDEGVARIIQAGADFRLAIKADDYADVDIDYIIAKWKLSDKRSVRGIYADQTTS